MVQPPANLAYRTHRQRNIDIWATFFRQCWRKALDYHKFEAEAKRVFLRAPVNSLDLFEAWSRQIEVQLAVSARMLRYLDILRGLKLIKETTVFDVIVKHLATTFDAADQVGRRGESAELGALVRMTSSTLYRIQNKSTRKAPDVQVSMGLFKLIGLFAGTALARGGIVTGIVLELGEAIANFLVAHVNDLSMAGVLALAGGNPPATLRRAFSKVVPAFIEVLTASGSPTATSLTLLQQQSKLQEGMADAGEEVAVVTAETMAFTQVPQLDAPVSPTRASLYAYLTAALTATPKLDDIGLQVFLDVRYRDDISAMSVDLITASFDVLAGAMERKEPLEVTIIHKSFITNKVPSILEQLSQHVTFQAGGKSIGQCVTTAIKRIDECYRNTAVLQPGSEACPKQRFLLACALFGFIHEDAVQGLLGYPPTQRPPKTRFEKTSLVQECQADTKRIEELVGELNLQEGNAGSIARALLEIMHTLCASRETMTLKMLCHAFLKKPHHINIMLLFVDARLLLQPLCQLLDRWQTQDDQGEQMMVYDEFGSILLFVLMCQYRYDLPISSLGTLSPDSFLLYYFRSGTTPKHAKDITDSERKHLVGWVKGLFEGNGLADELMSTCPPNVFYRLAATLADQVTTATQAGTLGIDTAISGVEYLLEPFLLPSLGVFFPLLATRLSALPAGAPQIDFLMPILVRLIKPPKISAEASPLHQAVLFISAKPLWQALMHIQSIQKNRQDVPQLLNVVKNSVQKAFTQGAARQLLDEWCVTRGEVGGTAGGVAIALSNSVDNLLKWNAPGKAAPDKQAYNHRLTVYATNCLGATKTLDLITDQALKAATNPKATDQALDTVTGLIVASTLTTSDAKISLRDALVYASKDLQGRASSRHSSARATFVMRLHRRVEEQCTRPIDEAPVIIALDVSGSMPDATAQGVALNAAGVAAAAAASIDMKDMPMQGAESLMAGLTEAAKTDVGGQSQQQSLGGDMSGLGGMGDMGDMQDMGFQDFLQDLNIGVGESQNFDDIFSQMA